HPGVRDGVLLCMRGDAERSMTDRNRNAVESLLHSHGLRWRITDMYCEAEVTKEARSDRVREKMEEFTRAALVITDRLHGMVFAAITGTPCIVFSNYNHKVRGTYAWIKYLPYIRYAETAADVERVLPELLSMEGCRYDNAPLMPYFEKLAQAVRDSTGN
ncbi:MAG: polysaccharide pyruvyl transferase family protein, partial [Gemmiger sp.]